MMNPELKAKWVTALRSGNYQQGRKRLYNAKDDTYCCLGVLCMVEGTDIEDARDGQTLRLRYQQNIGLTNVQEEILIDMNDGKVDVAPLGFTEIAEWIEANL